MKRTSKTPTKPDDDEDPRFAELISALAADPKFAAVIEAYAEGKKEPGRKFGSNGLKVNGKLFALFTQGKLVVKLPKERVDGLVAARRGEYFDPGHGRLMKQWIAISSTKLSWMDLAREAYEFVKKALR